MAHLRPGHSGRDRAQLLLVTGFVLAVTFVALALILNSAIFTENLATRGESVGGSGPVESRDVITDGIGSLIGYANANNNTAASYPATNLSRTIPRYENFTGRHYATDGELVVVEYARATNGTRVVHTNRTRSFASGGPVPADDWTPIDRTDRLRDVTFTVDRSSLAADSDCPSGDCFRVNVTSATAPSSAWSVAFSGNATHVTVESYTDGGPIGACSVAGSDVTVDLTGSTIGTTDCQSLRFASGVSPPYRVTFANGDRATGRYSMVAGNESLVAAVESGAVTELATPASDDSPRATHAVYAATVDMIYVTDQTEYRSAVRVAPGEPR